MPRDLDGWATMTTEGSCADIARAWRAREAHRLPHLRQLGEAARSEASRLARLPSSEFGATRMILFGSLVRGDPQREGRDIDLAVEGFAPGRRFEAGGTLRLMGSRSLQMVDLAEVTDRMRDMIYAQGILLHETG
jgi:predicted nucleotidyltransferase